jgi:hypothetical protein
MASWPSAQLYTLTKRAPEHADARTWPLPEKASIFTLPACPPASLVPRLPVSRSNSRIERLWTRPILHDGDLLTNRKV